MLSARVLGTVVLLALVVGCDDSGPNISGIDATNISRIDVVPKIDTIFITDSVLPRDTVRFAGQMIGHSGLPLTGKLAWRTSDPAIATIDENGLVRPVTTGTVEVIASAGKQGKGMLVIERAQRSISIASATQTISVDDPIMAGDTVTFRGVARDENGLVVQGVIFTWSSSAPGVARVSATGVVSAAGLGTARITAKNGDLTATRDVTIRPLVQSVAVTVPAPRWVVGDSVQLVATATGQDGKPMSGRRFSWVSSNPAVATVDASGKMTVRAPGATTITATTGWVTNTSVPQVDVEPRVILSLAAGRDFTCGRISLDRAYCWGNDSSSQLGVKGDTVCVDALLDNVTTKPCHLDPLRITGNPSYTQVTAGGVHACGLGSDGRAFCWGNSDSGSVGDGQVGKRTEPALVTSALRFTALSAGERHTCGLLTGGVAYCWGLDSDGQLGSYKVATSTTPIPVDGGTAFASISAGLRHTCGVATNGEAWCWGRGQEGAIGDGGTTRRDSPARVSGGHTFRQISAGGDFSCGVATDGAGYCWGAGSLGQIGNGSTANALSPQPVSGGLSFKSIVTGIAHACGLTTSGTVYCWGTYSLGKIGSELVGTSPVALGGGLTFASITAGYRHTCGVRDNGEAYCWGSNVWGPFGDGLQALWRPQPVRVKMPQ